MTMISSSKGPLTMTGDKDYYKDYYKENRAELLEQRRERYRRDAAYRKRAKERARLRYRRMKLRKKRSRPRSGPGVRVERGRSYYSVSAVADVIGRDRQAVYAYHKKGIIPDTGIWFGKRRFYSERQFSIIKRAFSQARVVSRLSRGDLEEIGEKINRLWSSGDPQARGDGPGDDS